MIEKKTNITNLFILFLCFHLILWTLIPSITNQNLPLDTIEALAWGTNLDWGFNKHPPLSALMVEIMFSIFGNQDWAYYLLSQIFVFIAFIVVWKLSEEFFKNKLYCLISVFILEGIVFYNYTTPEFNVYVCQLPFRALVVYYCWKSFKQNDVTSWAFLGLFSALGFLSHYLFLYLIIGVVIFFIYQIIKSKKFNFKYIIPCLIFLLILTPHFFWLIDNDFMTIKYGLHRTGDKDGTILSPHLFQPFIFLFKQIVMLIPFIIIFLFLPSTFKFLKNFKDQKFLFLVFLNLIPILGVFLTSMIMGVKIRTMWMSPFYLFFGVLFIYAIKEKISLKKIKKTLVAACIFFLISPSLYSYVSISQKNKRTDYPGKEISYLVQTRWSENFSNNIAIVVGDEWVAGNLSYHLPSRPKWLNKLDSVIDDINSDQGIIYTGNPNILKKVCPGIYGTIKPIGICMIGSR